MLHFFSFYLSTIFFFPGPGCDSIPPLNQKIISYAKKQVGKKVGRGECWDLAAQSLDFVKAKWDHDYKFGKEVRPGKDCIYPGDIMQFEGVMIEYRRDKSIYYEDLQHHTAIVHTVKNKDEFMVFQQNTSEHGRKVSVDPLRLKDIKKGKFKIYRPVN